MPKDRDALIWNSVLEAVAALPAGASLEEINSALKQNKPPLEVPRRTLQRHLATWVAQERLRPSQFEAWRQGWR